MAKEIMVVDTPAAALQPLAALLRDRGYALHVLRAEDNPVAHFAQREHALVALDASLPDAVALCEGIRACAAGAITPIVFCGTPDAAIADVATALASGADAYLPLPLQAAAAVAQIRDLVGASGDDPLLPVAFEDAPDARQTLAGASDAILAEIAAREAERTAAEAAPAPPAVSDAATAAAADAEATRAIAARAAVAAAVDAALDAPAQASAEPPAPTAAPPAAAAPTQHAERTEHAAGQSAAAARRRADIPDDNEGTANPNDAAVAPAAEPSHAALFDTDDPGVASLADTAEPADPRQADTAEPTDAALADTAEPADATPAGTAEPADATLDGTFDGTALPADPRSAQAPGRSHAVAMAKGPEATREFTPTVTGAPRRDGTDAGAPTDDPVADAAADALALQADEEAHVPLRRAPSATLSPSAAGGRAPAHAGQALSAPDRATLLADRDPGAAERATAHAERATALTDPAPGTTDQSAAPAEPAPDAAARVAAPADPAAAVAAAAALADAEARARGEAPATAAVGRAARAQARADGAALPGTLSPPHGELSPHYEVADLLLDAFDQRATGHVVLAAGQRRHTLYLEAGEPVGMGYVTAFDRIEDFLLRGGRITRQQYQQARARRLPTPRQVTAYLLAQDYLKPHEVFAAVRDHLQAQVIELFNLEAARFSWDAERLDAAERTRLTASVPALVAAGVRQKYLLPRLMARVGGPSSLVVRRPIAAAAAGAALRALGCDAHEQEVAALLDGEHSLEDVIYSARREPELVYRVAATLVILGEADIVVRGVDGGLGGDGHPDPEHLDRIDRARVQEKLVAVRHADYYRIVGLTPAATAVEVARACDATRSFFAAPRFSPRLQAELAPALDEIGEVLAEAQEILCNPRIRAAYTRHLRP